MPVQAYVSFGYQPRRGPRVSCPARSKVARWRQCVGDSGWARVARRRAPNYRSDRPCRRVSRRRSAAAANRPPPPPDSRDGSCSRPRTAGIAFVGKPHVMQCDALCHLCHGLSSSSSPQPWPISAAAHLHKLLANAIHPPRSRAPQASGSTQTKPRNSRPLKAIRSAPRRDRASASPSGPTRNMNPGLPVPHSM